MSSIAELWELCAAAKEKQVIGRNLLRLAKKHGHGVSTMLETMVAG